MKTIDTEILLFTRRSIVACLLMLCARPVAAQSYEQLVEQGIRAAQADSLLRAETLFKQALRTAPTDYRNALLFSNLGNVQERLYWENTTDKRRAEDAIESYTLALRLAPTAVPILLARAKFYLNLSQLGKAQADLTSILDVAPANTEARNLRAYIYAQQRQYANAKADYEQVLRNEADNYVARLGMVVLCQQQGLLEEALERVSLMLETEPDRTELLSVRAGIYAENSQLELAILDLDRAIELAPDNANYVVARGYLHRQRGAAVQARRDFERAVRLGVPRGSLDF